MNTTYFGEWARFYFLYFGLPQGIEVVNYCFSNDEKFLLQTLRTGWWCDESEAETDKDGNHFYEFGTIRVLDINKWRYGIMYFLEKVFKSNNFDLNDAVLTDYDIYFDESSKNYNYFSLDDEELPNLHRFIDALKVNDPNSKIFVLTYGYELTSNNGEKSTYADQLWIDTNLSIYEVKDLVSVIGLTEPSEIRYFCDCNEIEYFHVYLISQTKNGESIIGKIEKEKVNQVVTLYWD